MSKNCNTAFWQNLAVEALDIKDTDAFVALATKRDAAEEYEHRQKGKKSKGKRKHANLRKPPTRLY